jgi:prepilin-type N-terminal cleavage/methylation domain-containing protein
MLTRRTRAFTLVELLVVIGIIAVLIGILLPVMSRVQERGRALKCQSNLRSIGQGLMSYMAENRGSLPYGETWERFNPVNGSQAEGNDGRITSWASWITAMGRGKTSPVYNAASIDDSIKRAFGEFLKCPEAEMLGRQQIVHYVAHIVAMPSPTAEHTVGRSPGSSGRPIRPPAKQDELLPFNALVWDTAVIPAPPSMAGREDRWEGWLLGADIDTQQIWYGAAAAPADNFRYFFVRDRLASFNGGIDGNNAPIRHNVGSFAWQNIDPGMEAWTNQYPWQGNLRYRHDKNNTAMVLFADWSVQGMKLKEKDLRIKNFRIKPLSNTVINRSIPN